MKILAFDTSSAILSLALWDEGKIKAEYQSDSTVKHSNVLLSEMQKLLHRSRTTLADVDYLAVGLGPGSFTGLRVGVTTAKVLAYALNKKCVGVSSLEALAREAMAHSKEGRVTVMLDAKKSSVYAASYEVKSGIFRETKKPAIFAAESDWPAQDPSYPKARWIAEGAWARIKNKKFTDPFKLEPLYLYPRDCNVTRKK